MTGRDKIEKLTNSWYGFNLFGGAALLLMNGIGIFSLVWCGLSTAASLAITFILGRKLMNRSSFTRSALIVLSTIMGILSVIGLVGSFMRPEFTFHFLIQTIVVGSALSMHVKSLRTLTDRDVKAYFA